MIVIFGLQIARVCKVNDFRSITIWLDNVEVIRRLDGSSDTAQLKSHLVLNYESWTETRWVIDKIKFPSPGTKLTPILDKE